MQDRAGGGPAIMLMVSGILSLVYSVLFLIWTLLPFGTGVLMTMGNIAEHGVKAETISFALMVLSVPTLQVMAFVLCCILSVLSLWGGIRYNHFESKGLVFLALAAATGTPVVGLIANSASSVSCGTLGAGVFGCILGNVGTIPVLIIGLCATIWGVVDLTGPNGDRFE